MDQPDIQQRWRDDGWLHLPSFFTAAEIESVNVEVGRMWESRPRGVTVDDLDTGRRCRMSALDAADRRHRVKISDLYLVSPTIRKILLAPKLVGLLRPLLGEEPVLCNSLNLEKSSEQDNHVDGIYMTPLTAGKLVAIWIALEDIHLDAGPLRVWPGSHQVPPYTFSDGSRHSIDAEMRQWGAAMQVELDRRRLHPVAVPASAGDLIVWHSDLLHGAEPIRDANATRRSMVGHYFSLADSRRRGYRLKKQRDAWWIARRQQPVDTPSRVLSAIERRVDKLRALFRAGGAA
jgi:phytanoyl-CoA hydroxylase